ncbi:MAG: ribonuclease P protein component [Kiritimatiellia bacterium]
MRRLDASDYRAVFNHSHPWHGFTLSIWVRSATNAGRRAGVVVSKKNFRRAVDRNRAKRLMREAFRLNRSQIAADVDLVISARRAMAGKSCADVSGDFEKTCRRAGIWRERNG